MKAEKVVKFIANRITELAMELEDANREAFQAYEQWVQDDAGAELGYFLEGMDVNESLIAELEAAHLAQWEMSEVKELASIGLSFKALVKDCRI